MSSLKYKYAALNDILYRASTGSFFDQHFLDGKWFGNSASVAKVSRDGMLLTEPGYFIGMQDFSKNCVVMPES